MRFMAAAAAAFGGMLLASTAHAEPQLCKQLPNAAAVETALANAVTTVAAFGAGLGNAMWATVVDAHGNVCLVVNSAGGGNSSVQDIWLGSRVISAQKANTANAFSLSSGSTGTAIALSTANLYSAVQPGGSLYGLQASNPVDVGVAYGGTVNQFGKGKLDPLVGTRIGGVNVFGGGLAVYDSHGNRLGAIGVSGDTSCTDHAVAWETRNALMLDYVPGGVSSAGDDNIIYDITSQAGQMPGVSAGGFGHPHCLNATAENSVLAALPATRKPQ
ncbi:MAG TPA: heme-binding protein [Stellaceae bacterium]|nr:heme-binding protein [Stellaceae bacterium]